MTNLLNFGFVYFKNEESKLAVKDQNLDVLRGYLDQISKNLKKWNEGLNIIYNYSTKATMLGGRKVKDFYLTIKGQSKK